MFVTLLPFSLGLLARDYSARKNVYNESLEIEFSND